MRLLAFFIACSLLATEVVAAPVTLRFVGEVTAGTSDDAGPALSGIGPGAPISGVWTYDDDPADSLVALISFANPDTNDPIVFPGAFPEPQQRSLIEALFSAGTIDITLNNSHRWLQPSFISALAGIRPSRFTSPGGGVYQVLSQAHVASRFESDPAATVDLSQQDSDIWVRLDFAGFAVEGLSAEPCIEGDNGECFRAHFDPTTLPGPITGGIGLLPNLDDAAIDFRITRLIAVPEPATIGVAAACALAGLRRRR